jgi:hypothetical protein
MTTAIEIDFRSTRSYLEGMKKQIFSKVSQVKKMSRVVVGPVPPTKVVPHKDRDAENIAKSPKQTLEQENLQPFVIHSDLPTKLFAL